jgi:FMN phosphatase YigB (HAD superfamily)
MGGTLVQSSPSFYEALHRAYSDSGTHASIGEFRKGLRGAWAKLGGTYGEQAATKGFAGGDFWVEFNKVALQETGHGGRIDELSQNIWRRAESLLKDAKLYRPAGVLEVLSELKDKGYVLGVISNWDESLAQTCERFGFTKYLDVIVASKATGVAKPHPRLFEAGLQRAVVKGYEALYVGDVYYTDAVGASQAGLTPILLDPDDLFPDVPCARIRELKEVIPWLLQSVKEP